MLVAAIASCKNRCEHVGKYGYGPVLLLFGVHSDGLCSVEPVASGVFPHALGCGTHTSNSAFCMPWSRGNVAGHDCLRSSGFGRHTDIRGNIRNLRYLLLISPGPSSDHSSLPSSSMPGSLCHTARCFGLNCNQDAWHLLSPPRCSGALSSRSGL